MSLYPSDPRPISPYNFRINWPTVGGGPEWAPQDRALTRFGLCEADVSYRGKSWAQITTLRNFYESVHGASGRFTFADFNGIGSIGGTDPGVPWSGLFIAKGNSVTLIWDLPTFGLVNDSVLKVYQNGSERTRDVYTTTPDTSKNYHVKIGAGTDGVDQMTAQASITSVATAPSPATTGTSLVVHAGDGAGFQSTPFYAVIWPAGSPQPTTTYEIVHVTGRITDTLTTVRAQLGTTARSVIVGDQIAVPPAGDVILTIDATCRRAFRRAKFLQAKNPFVLNVVANYYQGPVTILEVRR
jgi:hypothetical protein